MSEPTRSQILKAINELKEEVKEIKGVIEERRHKSDTQLEHEKKVFDGWVRGQLGQGGWYDYESNT